jgi:transposase
MYLHANAKLGLAGRLALVQTIEGGSSIRAAAERFSVSPATAHRWWRRRREAGREERQTLACLRDRSSRPLRSPRELAAELQERICACRRETGWGPRLVAATGFAHSTVWKVLRRAGISRPPRPSREPANSYEWPCPGDLLHMDVSRYARFEQPGHAVTGDRSHRRGGWMKPETRVGYDYAHAIVDDHSRLAYVELHDDEKAQTVTGFLERALAFFAGHGIIASRLMTDNAFAYVKNRSLREPARPARDQAPDDRAVPAPYQRQGRALPPDADPRVGVRARLPLTSTAKRGPATPARALQPAQTAQLARRPASVQPRSQRLWVGQLATGFPRHEAARRAPRAASRPRRGAPR